MHFAPAAAPAQTRDNRTIKPVTLTPTSTSTHGIALPFLSLQLSKSYPLRRFNKTSKTKMVKKSRPVRAPEKLKPLTTNNATPIRVARQLAHLSQQTPTVTQKVEQATADYSNKFHTKGKLTASDLGPPSLNHIMSDDTVFEHMCLHLFLSDFLSTHEIEHLNAYNILFHHFHKILHHMQPEKSKNYSSTTQTMPHRSLSPKNADYSYYSFPS